MPMQRELYPDDWDAIATAIKSAANWHCQECGKPCLQPGEDFSDLWERLQGTEWGEKLPEEEDLIELPFSEFKRLTKSLTATFTLTVAHLNHVPSDCRAENLRALCAPCHCRYDTHPTQRAIKRRLKQERLGQLPLELE